jgi:hypothetical protein
MEVRDAKNSLCSTCHAGVAIKAHTERAVGMEHDQIFCVDCHATKTMQTGAGTPGKSRDRKMYWTNDITAHLFDVPRKTNKAVKGVDPSRAMPIPFTNACGECHDVSGL